LFARRGVERNGVYGEEGAAVVLATFFEVAQACVEYFFHAAEFGAPQIAHIVEAGIHMHGKEADQCGIEQHRNADREIELLVGHQS
jgi:hypothetical protein